MKKVNITPKPRFQFLLPFLLVFAFGFISSVIFKPSPKVVVVLTSGDKIDAKGVPIIKNQILYVGAEEIDVNDIVRCEIK